nr:PilZ domain-containing protein [Thalassobacillus devorans]
MPDENKFKRIQRRKFVRIETAVDVAIKSRGEHSFTSITTDISGGGAAIVLPYRHGCAPGTLVEMLFVFHMKAGDIHYIDAKAEIVRVFKSKGMERESASVEFHDITDGSRQTIIQFCFERQLYMKGKRVR